jgi:hypothetical protein
MVFLLVSFYSLVAILSCLPGYPFVIARYLAAKFGTYSWLSPHMSSLLWVDDLPLELTLFFFLFTVNCLLSDSDN